METNQVLHLPGHHPVGLFNLWSPRFASRECAGLLARWSGGPSESFVAKPTPGVIAITGCWYLGPTGMSKSTWLGTVLQLRYYPTL